MNPPALRDLFPMADLEGSYDLTLVTEAPFRRTVEGLLALWPGGESLRDSGETILGRPLLRFLWFGGIQADLDQLEIPPTAAPVAVEDSTFVQVTVAVDSVGNGLFLGLGNDHNATPMGFWVVEHRRARDMKGVFLGSSPDLPRLEGYFCAVKRRGETGVGSEKPPSEGLVTEAGV
jgi:hypothetical protein